MVVVVAQVELSGEILLKHFSKGSSTKLFPLKAELTGVHQFHHLFIVRAFGMSVCFVYVAQFCDDEWRTKFIKLLKNLR